MQEFFQQQYSQEELQRLQQQHQQQQHQHAQQNSPQPGCPMNMSAHQIPTTQQEQMGIGNMANMGHMSGLMQSGETLDDIIMQNERRRHSLPHQQIQQMQIGQQQYQAGMDNIYNPMQMRSGTMVEFGAGGQGDLNTYQFGAQLNPSRMAESRAPSDQRVETISVFAGLASNMDLTGASDFAIQQSPQSMAMGAVGPYSMPQVMSSSLMGGMIYPNMNNMAMTGMHDDQTPIVAFNPNNFSHPFTGQPMSSIGQEYVMPHGTAPPISHRNSSGHIEMSSEDENKMPSATDPSTSHSSDSRLGLTSLSTQTSLAYSTTPNSSGPNHMPAVGAYSSPSDQRDASKTQVVFGPKKAPAMSAFQGVYSSSGFDMVGCLMRVAQRKNPEIEIGPVDMSCAFVVCDVQKPDCPIIYVSEIFERLTGYNKHEVLMQNCRFLQSPDGKVQAGIKRRYVDDNVVYALKRRIKKRREVQRTLINYRKGGQAFTNLLTMIPISWDNPDEIRYYVGFQVDLVDKPGAVGGKSTSGTFSVNYQQIHLPKYVWQPPDSSRSRVEAGQTISREDVSAVLAGYPGSFDTELTRRMWDRLLLENTDDVVHVLSLKGLFLYLSPSSRHVLEYSAAELVGTALSSVCHPSDIVPVTRELKDASSGQPVSVVFRIRRKVSGYTWFESHGSLCVEQGKGRKCIILVGRERPVYTLSIHDVEAAGGINEREEMWSKLATSGMFLFVASQSRQVLDRTPEELQGTSIQALMRAENKVEFGRFLERARTGKTVSYKHDIMHKRGNWQMAQTTVYPGDATEGTKPTFLIAQTRLIGKPSGRNGKGSGNGGGAKQEHSHITYPGDNVTINSSSGTPISSSSTLQRDHVLTTSGQHSLPLGDQSRTLASPSNIFAELQTTRCTSWQFELRQLEKTNRMLSEELAGLVQRRKKRKRRKGGGELRDCKNCHTRTTPEWRRGPSGKRDLCNSCGLRWAKQVSRQGGQVGKDRGGAVAGVSSEGSSSGASGGAPVIGGANATGQPVSTAANVVDTGQRG